MKITNSYQCLTQTNLVAVQIVYLYGTDVPGGYGQVKRRLLSCSTSELMQDGYPLKAVDRAMCLELHLDDDETILRVAHIEFSWKRTRAKRFQNLPLPQSSRYASNRQRNHR